MELIISAITAWYILAGVGFSKLLKHNKQGVSSAPLILEIALWPMVIILVALSKEEE